jgi:hypothetical protein
MSQQHAVTLLLLFHHGRPFPADVFAKCGQYNLADCGQPCDPDGVAVGLLASEGLPAGLES